MTKCTCKNPNITTHCEDDHTCVYACNKCGKQVSVEQAFFISPPLKELEQPKQHKCDQMLVVFTISFMILSLILLAMYWSAKVKVEDIRNNYYLTPQI